MKNILFAALLGLSLVGCASATTAPVVAPMPAGGSVKKVGEAIKKGAASRGWMVTNVADKTIDLSLNVRTHIVKVQIVYDDKSYAINYVDSANMNFNPTKNTIHAKYQKWVAKLRESIDMSLNIAVH
jgi:hypothetical protein